jgi:hypothetical protein
LIRNVIWHAHIWNICSWFSVFVCGSMVKMPSFKHINR